MAVFSERARRRGGVAVFSERARRRGGVAVFSERARRREEFEFTIDNFQLLLLAELHTILLLRDSSLCSEIEDSTESMTVPLPFNFDRNIIFKVVG